MRIGLSLALLPRLRVTRIARSSPAAVAVLALTVGVLNAAPQNAPAASASSTLQAVGTAAALTSDTKARKDAPSRNRPRADRPDVRTGQSPARPAKKSAKPRARTAAEIWADARARYPAPKEYTVRKPRRVDCTRIKCVALTFDDGPQPGLTDQLLELLATEHVRATFFVLGKNVAADPGPLIRAAWDGHEIGAHTWSHQAMPGRSVAEVARDLTRTMNQITRSSGVRPWLVRPPFGAMDSATVRNVPYPLVLWSVDPYDWRDKDRELIVQRVTAEGRPGSIVLLHDVHPESVAAVPAIIDFYQRHGYAFVTVSELYGRKLRAHRVHRGREEASLRAKAVKPEPAPARPVEPTPTPTPYTKPDEAEVAEGAGPDEPSPEPTTTPTPQSTPPPEQRRDPR